MLVDENVEHVESDLRALGHDVEHVVQVPSLGRGAADRADIVPYLKRTGRLILTTVGALTEDIVDDVVMELGQEIGITLR